MIFGSQYYELLSKLSPWRQSLFALVLTQRQAANFGLWCEINDNHAGLNAFKKALKSLWDFHREKFNHIDLEKVIEEVEPYMLSDEKEDLSVGDLFGLDACLSLAASVDAIILHDGDEAEIASRSSLAGVIRKVEQSEGELSDEVMREREEVDHEVNFQIELLELLQKSKRSPELTKILLDKAYEDDMSNIGIPLEGFEKQDYTA